MEDIYDSVIGKLIANASGTTKGRSESGWYEKVTKNFDNPKLKDLDDLRKKVNVHRKCKQVKDGRIPALYCRLILEYICQSLLLIGLDTKKIKISEIKKRYKDNKQVKKCKYADLFIFLKLEDVINLLNEKMIKRKDNDTVTMSSLIISLQNETNEALHLKLDNKKKIIKKNTPLKLITETTNRLIEEFLEKFERYL